LNGLRELALGDEEKAMEHLKDSVHLTDGAFLAGFLALKKGHLDEAQDYLTRAAEKHQELGKYLDKYGVSAIMCLSITDEVTANVGPDLRGVLLALVEIYQRKGEWQEAVSCLERLLELESDDVVVRLSLAELLMDIHPGDREAYQRVVQLAEGVTNETPIHTALLFYKARALRELGLRNAARDILTQALRRKKGRSPELLKALRYERALVYEALGQKRRARADLEKIYAEDPDYSGGSSITGTKSGV